MAGSRMRAVHAHFGYTERMRMCGIIQNMHYITLYTNAGVMTSIGCNTTQSYGLRDCIVINSSTVYESRISRQMRVAVLDRQPAVVRDGSYCYLMSVEGASVVCSTPEGPVHFSISDDSLIVPNWSRYSYNYLDCLAPLLHMCMDGPMQPVSRGWQTTGSILFKNQSISYDTLTITFKHTLSELGIPAWMPLDTHPLTRHLVGVADNLAEVDPALSGDPRVFAKRAFEVFDDEVEFIFVRAINHQQPLDFINNSWFNRVFRHAFLKRYNSDKVDRAYAYSK